MPPISKKKRATRKQPLPNKKAAGKKQKKKPVGRRKKIKTGGLTKHQSLAGLARKFLTSLILLRYLKKLKFFDRLSPLKPLQPLMVPFLLLGLALWLVGMAFAPKDAFQIAKESLARNQNRLDDHLILIEEFLANNQLAEAEKELVLAEYIDPSSAEVADFWQAKRENDPEDIPELIAGWEQLLAQNPGYRDGHLRLAVLYYKLGEKEIARFHLQEAINLEPNFEPARELEKAINN